jgi:hypothetical protein
MVADHLELGRAVMLATFSSASVSGVSECQFEAMGLAPSKLGRAGWEPTGAAHGRYTTGTSRSFPHVCQTAFLCANLLFVGDFSCARPCGQIHIIIM